MSPYDRYSVVRFLEPVCLDLSSYERPGSDSRRTPGLIGKISDHWLSALPTGGDDGIRTHDPLLAGQVLSQLSYTPILFWGFLF